MATCHTNIMATFHEVISKYLVCPICLTHLNQPKLLVCSHRFCQDCLEQIVQSQPDQQTVACPVCRAVTPLLSGGVGELQTNVLLSSLVEEVKAKIPTCTVCEMDEKPPAVSYCKDCGKYMCRSCEKGHSTWKALSNHEVVPVTEVLAGNVRLKSRRKCEKHPNYDEEYFCIRCREYTCSKCGVSGHLQAGHQLERAAVHEEKLLETIMALRERVKSKKAVVENRIECIETQRKEITNILRKLNTVIDKTYEEYMQLLSVRREELKCQVRRLSEKFEKELYDMDEESRRTILLLNAMEELVTNGMKVPQDKDALFAHDTMCENFESILGRDDFDDQSPRGVTERAQKISFSKYVYADELYLGEVEGYEWAVKADVELPLESNCMTRVPDGKMAMGSFNGGIYLYSPDGELQQTVLEDIAVCGIGFLSDSRSVVRDIYNKISLYTPEWEKLDVTFETMSSRDGVIGGLTVDGDDNIYVGYWKPHRIQVFTLQGGKAVREIMCDEHSPVRLFSFRTTRSLILTDTTSVVCLDGNGKERDVLKVKEGRPTYPAVCRDDSVLVAWGNHEVGLVSIDRYTRDLEYLHNVITDFKLQTPEKGYGYRLQEFASGEIAFSTPDRLYVFDCA